MRERERERVFRVGWKEDRERAESRESPAIESVVALAKYFYGSLVKLLVKYFCSILNILRPLTHTQLPCQLCPPTIRYMVYGMYGANNEILIKPKQQAGKQKANAKRAF